MGSDRREKIVVKNVENGRPNNTLKHGPAWSHLCQKCIFEVSTQGQEYIRSRTITNMPWPSVYNILSRFIIYCLTSWRRFIATWSNCTCLNYSNRGIGLQIWLIGKWFKKRCLHIMTNSKYNAGAHPACNTRQSEKVRADRTRANCIEYMFRLFLPCAINSIFERQLAVYRDFRLAPKLFFWWI